VTWNTAAEKFVKFPFKPFKRRRNGKIKQKAPRELAPLQSLKDVHTFETNY